MSSPAFPVVLPPAIRLLRILRVAAVPVSSSAQRDPRTSGPRGFHAPSSHPPLGSPPGVGGKGGQSVDRVADDGGRSCPVTPTNAGAGGRLNLLISWGGGGWRTDSWADALPSLLEPMGVRSVRVSSAREAERFIRANIVHIAVVDLGLPINPPLSSSSFAAAQQAAPMPTEESGGARVLELLRRLESPPPTVVVKAPPTRRDDARHISAALRSDAFAVVDRGAADLELMLKVLHRCFDRYYQGRWPGGVG